MAQRFEDPARELPEYHTLEEKVDLLTTEVLELRQRIEDAKKSWENIDTWFRESVNTLADDAIKEFIRLRSAAEYAIETVEQKKERLNFEAFVQQVVEAKFKAEAPEMATAIFEAIKKQIQPHALR